MVCKEKVLVIGIQDYTEIPDMVQTCRFYVVDQT